MTLRDCRVCYQGVWGVCCGGDKLKLPLIKANLFTCDSNFEENNTY